MTVYVGHDPVVDLLVAGQMDEPAGYRTLRPQGSATWLLVVTERGGGWWRSGSSQGHADPSTAMLLPPHESHDYGTDSGWGFWFAHFRAPGHWADLLRWRSAEVHDQQVLPRAGQLVDLARSSARLAMNALEEVLLRLAPLDTSHEPRVAAVLAHVHAHLDGDLDLPSLARVAALSPDRLSRLFREQVGTGLRAYVEERRMEQAARLLRTTDLPVARVARACGYAEPTYFTNRFTRAHGVSPSRYRR